jgi:hypothetical protein
MPGCGQGPHGGLVWLIYIQAYASFSVCNRTFSYSGNPPGVAEDCVLNKKDSSRELAFKLMDEAIHLLDDSDDNLAAAHLEMAIALLPPLPEGKERVRRPRNNVSL